jgi:hypothetical protein
MTKQKEIEQLKDHIDLLEEMKLDLIGTIDAHHEASRAFDRLYGRAPRGTTEGEIRRLADATHVQTKSLVDAIRDQLKEARHLLAEARDR